MGYFISGSYILMRWSYGLHLGWGTVVCGLDIENPVAVGLMNINEQVSHVIPWQFQYWLLGYIYEIVAWIWWICHAFLHEAAEPLPQLTGRPYFHLFLICFQIWCFSMGILGICHAWFTFRAFWKTSVCSLFWHLNVLNSPNSSFSSNWTWTIT